MSGSVAGAPARKRVAVIGAGVSGLAAGRAFGAHGHDVTILERSHDLGGVWEPSRSYPEVQTQSPKELYRYTSKAMPRDYPEWPTGPQVHAYLREFAAENDLMDRIRFGTRVARMERRAVAPGWTLHLEGPDGEEALDYDFVVVCTGQFSEKNLVEHPGRSEFEAAGGRVLHSSEYTDATAVRDRDVVVLGFSKSATDVATNAARSGARSVTVVYRESVWRIPYFIGGLVNFKRILYVRAQERMFAGWGQTRRSRAAHALARPMVWANWRALEALLTVQLKLRRTGLRPRTPIEAGINCAVPIATPGFFDLVVEGRIRCVQGTFEGYEPGSVHVTGGESVPCDLAVLAVGWKLGLPFLPEEHRARLVDPDGQYRLHRLIVNPDLPDMGFVGMNSSFASVLSADLAAHWLVRFADGRLARQPSEARMREDIEALLRWRREERPAAGVYGGLCVAPYHFKHFDELVDDIGATVRRRNPIAEHLTPPDAGAYGHYLASAPGYRAA